MKRLFLIVILGLNLSAGEISPFRTVSTTSEVLDIVFKADHLWAGTADGKVLKMTTEGKIVSNFTMPSIQTAWGETTPQKVMSLDVSPSGKTVAVAGEDGVIYTVSNGTIVKTAYQTPAVIKKIGFISDNRLLIALLSNEIIWFDLSKNTILKAISGGTSPLSDMALSSDRKLAVIGGEAGVVGLIDTLKGRIIRTIHGGNVDNIYKLDYQNRRIITAGQDRRVIVYTEDGKKYVRLDGSFLVYSAALSPKGTVFAAGMDEKNRISVYNISSKKIKAVAIGHNATLNRIVFINEKRFVSCADENKILFWELP